MAMQLPMIFFRRNVYFRRKKNTRVSRQLLKEGKETTKKEKANITSFPNIIKRRTIFCKKTDK